MSDTTSIVTRRFGATDDMLRIEEDCLYRRQRNTVLVARRIILFLMSRLSGNLWHIRDYFTFGTKNYLYRSPTMIDQVKCISIVKSKRYHSRFFPSISITHHLCIIDDIMVLFHADLLIDRFLLHYPNRKES